MPSEELPTEVVAEAARLTRLARRVPDEPSSTPHGESERVSEADRYRDERDAMLADYGFSARVREEGDGAVLVCYPDAWLEDGLANIEAIEDTDRAVERRLDGAGDAGDWDTVVAHNRDLAARVDARHGDPHGATATAFAEFMANHHVRRVETATASDILEFVDDYFPRNAFPDDAQRSRVIRSVRYLLKIADKT
ncbi:MAG: rnhA operon protein [Halobacteriaceae archaeon]